MDVETVIPTQCHLWSKEPLTKSDLRFRMIETYSEENHFEQKLLECADCGQVFYSQFYEEIDWEDGNDSQYSTFIPIQPSKETIERLNKSSPIELLQFIPRLHYDSKTETTIKWARQT